MSPIRFVISEFKFLRNVSAEMKILLGIAVAFMLTVWGATALRESDRRREKDMADNRTKRAMTELYKNRAEADSVKMAHLKLLEAKMDSVLMMLKHFVWVIVVAGGVACM